VLSRRVENVPKRRSDERCEDIVGGAGSVEAVERVSHAAHDAELRIGQRVIEVEEQEA
jgi:hypothetical protein